MKQQKLNDYKPSYPKKAIKGMTLAAAALLTIGAATGCRHLEPQIMGEIAVDDDPTPGVEETLPPEEELRTDGIVVPEETPEPTEEPMVMGTPAPIPTEEPMLMGDVAIIEP